MLSHFRRIIQVVALTFVLVFGTLLIVGSFEMPAWSHPHSVHKETTRDHIHFLGIYTGRTTTVTHYIHNGH